jgi:alpha-amylase
VSSVILYFQVHQPWRLKRYTWFDVGREAEPFDEALNARILKKVARRCYVPATAMIERLVERGDGDFRCAFSVSGTALDQLERFAPEALAGFRRLAATGRVEFLGETSHHSLSFLGDPTEFRAQMDAHARRIEATFGRKPATFRNTELVISAEVARAAEAAGYATLLGEGADHLLGFRDAARVYRPEGTRLSLLLRSYALSDDIAFRFTDRGWPGWPLTPEKFAAALERVPGADACVGLFMDFETAGEHQDAASGILAFLEALPAAVATKTRFRFRTPSEVTALGLPPRPLALPEPVSWADAERDLSAWLGNDMQRAAHQALYALLPAVRRAAEKDPALLETWRRLSTSDHVYYMCTKYFSDGDVHKYFSPYATPHDAFITFMNVLDDLAQRSGAEPPALVPVRGGAPR